MKFHFASLCGAALLACSNVSFAWFEGEGAPAEFVERVKNLTLKKDYPALLAMLSELDARFAGKYNTEYFTHLAGVELGMGKARGEDKVFDVERAWVFRKLLWRIMLTPYAETKDAGGVLTYKGAHSLNGFAVADEAAPAAPEHQIAALRTDAIALLRAYRDFLRARTIPNYKPQFQFGPVSMPATVFRTREEQRKNDLKQEKLQAQSVANGYKNAEQEILTRLLGKVGDMAADLVLSDFWYPPEDDAMVRQLLADFPPEHQTYAIVVNELDHLKHRHRADREKEAERLRLIQAGGGKEP